VTPVSPRGAGGRALLHPASVALVGASDDASSPAARPLRFLRRAGYTGRVFPVNPRRDTVAGERSWPSVDSLPEVPSHAFVLTGRDRAPAMVEACADAGIPVVTVLADGLAEGPGADRLREIVARTGVRLLGPGSIGVVHVRGGLTLTANAAFAEPAGAPGGVFVASQSGSMIGALLSRGQARGVGFAGLVSVGGELDLSLGEVCAAALDDPDVTSYLLFLETLRHAAALRAFAAEAARRGRPVAAYKIGRTAQAAELARAHTGALAGEDDVASAFLADCGIARLDTLDGLLEAPALLGRVPAAHPTPGRPPRVGVVATTGGGAAMVVDRLGVAGVAVLPPGEPTVRRLAEAGLTVAAGRIMDLTMAGARYEVMRGALGAALGGGEFDLVIAVIGSTARFEPEVAVAAVTDAAEEHKPPTTARGSTAPGGDLALARLAAFVAPEAPVALALLAAAGVPAFRSAESCADAVAAAFARRPPRRLPGGPPSPPSPPSPLSPPRASRRPMSGASDEAPEPAVVELDEAEACALLARVGLRHPPVHVLAPGARPDPAAALPFPFPVVVKVRSPDLPHRSDMGGVVLGVGGAEELRAAIEAVETAAARARPDARLRGTLVMPMITGGVGEALVGYRLDRDIGPLVVVAAGGLLAQLYADRSVRPAPVDHGLAREMIGEVRGLRALAGWRGRPAGDLDALADAVAAVSRLAHHNGTPVLDAEINPLIVLPAGQGVMAVDAVVRCRAAAPEGRRPS
jgi:acyl-CoA synthetase (NDP forming)